MQLITLCCFAVSLEYCSDAEYSGPAYAGRAEYSGPAYACRDDRPHSVAKWLKGTALILCVEAGIGPDMVHWLFGPPLLSGRDNKGPYEWSYYDLGVTVYFPPRLFKNAGQYERLNGNIGP